MSIVSEALVSPAPAQAYIYSETKLVPEGRNNAISTN